MIGRLRQNFTWLHSYAGLVFGWIAFGVLFTGTLAVFHAEINLWTSPAAAGIRPGADRAAALAQARAYLTEHDSDAQQWRIVLPTYREPLIKLVVTDTDGRSATHFLDPVSGRKLPVNMTAGTFLLRYHYMMGVDRAKNPTGFLIIGATAIAMLVLVVSGVILHKRILRDYFVFRPRASRQRSWLDLHNILSVIPLPFHVMMAYTGLVIIYYAYIPAGMHARYDGDASAFSRDNNLSYYIDRDTPAGAQADTAPLWELVNRAEQAWGGGDATNIYVSHPNRADAMVEIWRQRDDRISNYPDRVTFSGADGSLIRVLVKRSPLREARSFLSGLHFIEWGGMPARWAYFLCGLMSCGMVAAALVLFVEKRRARKGGAPPLLSVAQSLTVAAVGGHLVACAAYLGCERGLTAIPGADASLSGSMFFVIWLGSAVHAFVRPYYAAWTEQLVAGGILWICLPIISALTGTGLWQTLQDGDFVRAGFDLMALCGGVLMLLIGWNIRSGQAVPTVA
ncbi:hypothetical protein GRI97_09860 [Altererythrobacter xixiisoli]|uniref:PepSY domain-containing protein n=1 Tax=Croceibacterium xixiisoli TaxID=1476466 RepID=A0A6I4TY47_9SPHN|nr:PepSY-associated TM helix domain-containing protein [Croceibacterium xixiisoli]MXO99293.1 hypothetical protein [Croceibacterium xixiisoli]